jgi:hypothetical protein
MPRSPGGSVPSPVATPFEMAVERDKSFTAFAPADLKRLTAEIAPEIGVDATDPVWSVGRLDPRAARGTAQPEEPGGEAHNGNGHHNGNGNGGGDQADSHAPVGGPPRPAQSD